MYQNADNSLRHGNGDPTGLKIAHGLGWFSIALGASTFGDTRADKVPRHAGNEPLVQLYGLREIATGIGIVMSKDLTSGSGAVSLVMRRYGTLAAHLNDENPEEANLAIASATW